ncbi:zinc resistance-associated protein ZraP [Serratia sp. S1B]|nr:zinc resistance-associated protein ZraP [Serratia sp. S1B]
MTLKKNTLTTLLSIVMLVGLSQAAMAQNGNRGQNMSNQQGTNQGMGYHTGYMANLTPEQQAISQKAFNEFQLKTVNLRQQMIAKNAEYNALLTSKPLDEQKALAVSKEISALHDQLYQQRVALDTELAKAGLPAMGHRGGMGGMSGSGMNNGRGCR